MLDTESATTLATVAKEKGVSLCGIKPEQTEADFSSQKTGYYMQPADAILLTADLAVRASLTSVRASPELQPTTGPALTHCLPCAHRLMLVTITSTRRPPLSSSLR